MLFTFLAMMSGALPLVAQDGLIMPRFTINDLFFNPAFAGSSDVQRGSIYLQHSKQWFGYAGAPVRMSLGSEVSAFGDRVGLGLSISNERIGLNSRTDLSTSYAYKLILNNQSTMSIGMRLGLSSFDVNYNNADQQINQSPIDPSFTGTDSKRALISGIGVYWHNERTYIGLSAPVLDIVTLSDDPLEIRKRQIYGNMGTVLGAEDQPLKLEPSLLLKYHAVLPLELNVGLTAWLHDTVGCGLMWNKGEALAIRFDLIALEKYRLTTSYDFPLSEVSDYRDNVLEVMMAYYFD